VAIDLLGGSDSAPGCWSGVSPELIGDGALVAVALVVWYRS
jgi:hypothetical protein